MSDRDSSWWLRRKLQRLLEEGRLSEAVDLIRQNGIEKEGSRLLHERGHSTEAMELLAAVGEFSEAGRMGLAGRNYTVAADYFEKSGDLLAAARAHESAGQRGAALKLYIRLNEVERVCALAMGAVDNPRMLQVAADFLTGRGETGLAVALLVKGRRPEEAGALLEKAGNFKEAIKVYESAALTKQAVAVYEKLGDHRRAAFVLMKLGEFCDAAEMLVRGGEEMQAARLFRRLGKFEEALAVLDTMNPSSADYADAAILASTILEQMEDVDEAARRLAALLDRIGYSPQNEEVIYRLVDLQLDLGDMDGAEHTLERAREDGGDAKVLTEQISVVREVTSEPPRSQPLDEATSTSLGFPNSQRYKMVSRVARGGHGELFLVRDLKLDREVVFKLLHSSSLPSKVARNYFQRESRAVKLLDHPNIVKVFDVGEIRGRPYYTMEYVRGHNLLELVDGDIGSPLGLEERLSVCRQICEALAHAHLKRVLHRDVKLDNVMLTQPLRVKLLDFGLAKALDENPHASHFIVGTPAYMSPEQLAGRMVDERTDIFSLGVLMYRFFTGKRPFDPSKDVQQQTRSGPPPDPRQYDDQLPAQLAETIMCCMEPEPDDRFRTVRHVAVALGAVPV
jgi:tetratricopeptide (TPR) repeat protein